MSSQAGHKPSLLVITSRYPFPVIGGDRLRVYHLCRILSNDFEVTLACLHEQAIPDIEPTSAERAVFKDIHIHHLPKWKSLAKTAFGLLNSYPMQVNYYWDAGFAKKIQHLSKGVDHCLFHLTRTARYADFCPDHALKVMEMTDAVSRNYQGMKKSKGFFSIRRQIFHLEYRKLVKYERKAVREFSLTTLVSGVDREYLLDNSDAPEGSSPPSCEPERIMVVPNGIAVDKYPFVNPWQINKVVGFIGNITSLQNFDACFYFASEVLPALRTADNVEFRIVGRIGESERTALEKFPGVVVTGEVESIPDAMTGVSIGVCPVRVSAGVQNKVLEYMALGLPAIVTFNSTIALELEHDHQVVVADSAQEFVNQFERLQNDPALCHSLRKEARAFVEKHHQWSESIARLGEKMLSGEK